LPTIERPELMEETSGAADDATAGRGVCCTDDDVRLEFGPSLLDFPSMLPSYSFTR
jgi:hypothetical protein